MPACHIAIIRSHIIIWVENGTDESLVQDFANLCLQHHHNPIIFRSGQASVVSQTKALLEHNR